MAAGRLDRELERYLVPGDAERAFAETDRRVELTLELECPRVHHPELGGQLFLRSDLVCVADKGFGNVDTDRAKPAPRELEAVPPGSAAYVENPRVGRKVEQLE